MPLTLKGPYGLGPPADLIARVTEQFPSTSADQARIDFFPKAVAHLRDHERALAGIGREFQDFERILDFGCGPGRLTRLLTELSPTVDIHGTDVDGELIRWACENIPDATFTNGPHDPPLPYPDAHFDLVINHSVFTHLDAQRQDLWLGELGRITRPGGVLLLTVHSTRQFNEALALTHEQTGCRWRDTLRSEGVLFITDDTFVGTTHPDWYHTAFHAPWYIFEHWTQWFAIRSYVSEGSDTQDLVVLERMSASDPMLNPIGHGTPAAPDAPSSAPPVLANAADEPALVGPRAEAPSATDLYQALIDDARSPAAQAFAHAPRGRAARRLRSLLDRIVRLTPGTPGPTARTTSRGAAGRSADRHVSALRAGQSTAARVDALTDEVRHLRETLGGVVEGLQTLHDTVVERDRTIGVLRAALDEQAQRTAAAIADLRRTEGPGPR